MNDDGNEFKVTMSNDCGQSVTTYVFEVKKSPPVTMWAYAQNNRATQGQSTQYPSASVGEDWFMNHYYQELDWYNWSTGTYDKYFKRWPTTWQQVGINFAGVTPSYTGCRAIRVLLNDSEVVGWTHQLFPAYTSNAFNAWQSWDSQSNAGIQIRTNPDETAWPKKQNIISVQISQNIPSPGNFSGGDITSFDIAVNFYKKPTITSRNNGGGGWWWCGAFYAREYGGWVINRSGQWQRTTVRWWRPWCWWNNNRGPGSEWTKKTWAYVRPNPVALPSTRGYPIISVI